MLIYFQEFRSWHQSHTERAHTFTGEENQLRTVFAAKLEKHFLRVIFQGIFLFYRNLFFEFELFLKHIILSLKGIVIHL